MHTCLADASESRWSRRKKGSGQEIGQGPGGSPIDAPTASLDARRAANNHSSTADFCSAVMSISVPPSSIAVPFRPPLPPSRLLCRTSALPTLHRDGPQCSRCQHNLHANHHPHHGDHHGHRCPLRRRVFPFSVKTSRLRSTLAPATRPRPSPRHIHLHGPFILARTVPEHHIFSWFMSLQCLSVPAVVLARVSLPGTCLSAARSLGLPFGFSCVSLCASPPYAM